MVEGIKAEMKAGKPMFKSAYDEHADKQKPKSVPNTDVSAKIFLLTDGHCVSACLGFADRLLAIPGAVHIGSPISADSNYMEVRDIDLPSGIGKMAYWSGKVATVGFVAFLEKEISFFFNLTQQHLNQTIKFIQIDS